LRRKPNAGCMGEKAPGVEKRNDRVVKKVQTASALPIAAARAEMGRAARSTAVASSLMPIAFEAPCSLKMPYSQLMKGLFDTSGLTAAASAAVNFNAPKSTKTATSA
jgi:hypothetical protein